MQETMNNKIKKIEKQIDYAAVFAASHVAGLRINMESLADFSRNTFATIAPKILIEERTKCDETTFKASKKPSVTLQKLAKQSLKSARCLILKRQADFQEWS